MYSSTNPRPDSTKTKKKLPKTTASTQIIHSEARYTSHHLRQLLFKNAKQYFFCSINVFDFFHISVMLNMICTNRLTETRIFVLYQSPTPGLSRESQNRWTILCMTEIMHVTAYHMSHMHSVGVVIHLILLQYLG